MAKQDSKKKKKGLPIPRVVDSGSLAQYPIAPVARNPNYDLKKGSDGIMRYVNRIEWMGQHPAKDGETTTWFIERSVPKDLEAKPNFKTQQVLSMLLYMLLDQHGENITDKELEIKLSASEVLRLMNGGELNSRPSDRSIKMVINHINILRNMRISIGYLNETKGKTDFWEVKESNIIGNSHFIIRENEKRVAKMYGEEQAIEKETTVHELKSLTFTAGFIQKYLAERITFDLFPYLRINSPTAQNAYRYMNFLKTTQANGKAFYYEDDLQKFSLVNLGLQSKNVTEQKQASRLAAQLRKELKPIHSYWEGQFSIKRDKRMPSGYAIVIENQPRLFDVASDIQLNEREKEAYRLLRFFGVYHIPAMDLIIHCQRAFFTEAGKYILFCVRQFNELRRLGEIKTPADKLGGFLVTFTREGYRYEQFLKELAKEKKEIYEPDPLFTVLPSDNKFDFEEFKKRYPEDFLYAKDKVVREFELIEGNEHISNSAVFIMAAVRAECFKINKKKVASRAVGDG